MTSNIWSNGFGQRCQDNSMGEKTISLTNIAGKTGYPHAEE